MGARICKKVFDFGKVDYNDTGRKNCAVDVELELKHEYNSCEDKNYLELSICGNIWNPRHTDIYCGGQCLDTINEYIKGNATFTKLYDWWKKYHLNGMHAGTPEQEEALDNYHQENNLRSDYKKDCEYLESINLYEVDYKGKPYKYGHSWLVQEIPEDIINEIKELCKE